MAYSPGQHAEVSLRQLVSVSHVINVHVRVYLHSKLPREDVHPPCFDGCHKLCVGLSPAVKTFEEALSRSRGPEPGWPCTKL